MQLNQTVCLQKGGMELDQSHITSLFENATEGLVITKSDGRILMVNPGACRMFQYSEEELIGQPIELLIPAHYREQHVALREEFYKDPGNRAVLQQPLHVCQHTKDSYSTC